MGLASTSLATTDHVGGSTGFDMFDTKLLVPKPPQVIGPYTEYGPIT